MWFCVLLGVIIKTHLTQEEYDMQTLLSRKSISMTELREPAKVIAQAGNTPVAILNRSQVVGYFVPVSAISPTSLVAVDSGALRTVLARRRPAISATLKYLEDK